MDRVIECLIYWFSMHDKESINQIKYLYQGSDILSRDRISAIIIIFFGLFMIYNTSQIQSQFAVASSDIGPKALPYIVSLGLIICGIGIFMQSGHKKSQHFLTLRGWKRLGLLTILLVLYIPAMKYIGFIIATPIVLFLISMLMGAEKKLSLAKAAFFSVIVSVCIYMIFVNYLHVQLPSGFIL